MSTPTTSWKVEVQVHGERGWSSNQLTFATEREAQTYGHDLFVRWTAVKEWRATRTQSPVTHTIKDGVAVPIEESTNGG